MLTRADDQPDRRTHRTAEQARLRTALGGRWRGRKQNERCGDLQAPFSHGSPPTVEIKPHRAASWCATRARKAIVIFRAEIETTIVLLAYISRPRLEVDCPGLPAADQ